MKKGKKIKMGLQKLTIAKLNDSAKIDIVGGSGDCLTLEPESVNNNCPDYEVVAFQRIN